MYMVLVFLFFFFYCIYYISEGNILHLSVLHLLHSISNNCFLYNKIQQQGYNIV